MKLIHCADLHLGSRMESGLSPAKAQERRMELLHTFVNMVERASSEGVEAMLLCGDLFDTEQVSVRTKSVVRNTIEAHPEIMFYYLRGNHDRMERTSTERIQNLRTFNDGWTTYEQGDITITGMELSGEWDPTWADQLQEELSDYPGKLHVVMLHGMASEYGQGEEGIALQDLRGRGIDYLALGHVHSFRQEKLDEQGIWCYSGCLEGRGFDECGTKGYVMLETVAQHLVSTFVPVAKRTLREVMIEIAETYTEQEIMAQIQGQLTEIPSQDLIKIVLKGQVSPECDLDLLWMKRKLESDYYFLKIKDQTKVAVRAEDYQYDRSLKGEFVRLVQETDLSEEDQSEILKLGIQALKGEA